MLRPLAGMLGLKAAEPSVEFLDSRRKTLDDYVKGILRTAGGNKTALWNHPVVLTFFDIPSVIQRNSPLSELSCPIPMGDWDLEFERAEVLLEEARDTKERMDNTLSRGNEARDTKERMDSTSSRGNEARNIRERMDSTSSRRNEALNYLKHFKRQISFIRKLIGRLQMALDFYVRADKIDDDRLSLMSGRFQILAGRVETLYSMVESESSVAETTVPPSTIPSK
jgi:hypothetical protein